jgi:hypothetical protein
MNELDEVNMNELDEVNMNELDVTNKNTGVPAYFQPDDFAENRAASSGTMGCPMIKLDQKTFCMAVGGEKESMGVSFNCIIVGVAELPSKAYFEDDFQPGVIVSPRCAAANGKTPDSAVKDPLCDQCSRCSKNMFGSKISKFSGKKTTACGSKKRIVVFLPNASPDNKFFRLDIPVTSFKNFSLYSKTLSAAGLPLSGVATKISFDAKSTFAQLVFANKKVLTKEDYLKVREIKKDPEVNHLLTMEVTGFDNEDGVADVSSKSIAEEDAEEFTKKSISSKSTQKRTETQKSKTLTSIKTKADSNLNNLNNLTDTESDFNADADNILDSL